MGSESLRGAITQAATAELSRRHNNKAKNTTEVAPNPQEAAPAGTEGVTKKRKDLFPSVRGKSNTTLSPSQMTAIPRLLGN